MDGFIPLCTSCLCLSLPIFIPQLPLSRNRLRPICKKTERSCREFAQGAQPQNIFLKSSRAFRLSERYSSHLLPCSLSRCKELPETPTSISAAPRSSLSSPSCLIW